MKQSNFAKKALFALMLGAASTVAFAQSATAPSTGSPMKGDTQEGGAKTGKTGSDRSVKAPGAAAVGKSSQPSTGNMAGSSVPGVAGGPAKPDNNQGGAKTGKTGSDGTMKSSSTNTTMNPTNMAKPATPGTPGGPYQNDATEGGAKTGKTGSGK